MFASSTLWRTDLVTDTALFASFVSNFFVFVFSYAFVAAVFSSSVF